MTDERLWSNVIFFLQIISNGLVTGAIFALVAVGFSLVFGVLGVFNVAHADFYTLGAYSAVWITVGTGLGSVFAPVAGAVIGAASGLLLYWLVLRRFSQHDLLTVFVATLGASYFIQNLLARVVGPDTKYAPSLFPTKTLVLFGDVRILVSQVVVLGAAIVLCLALHAWVQNSRIGRDMRAVSENERLAQSVGVNATMTMSITIAVGSAVAGLGGVIVTNFTQTANPYLAVQLGLPMIIVTMVAGAGSIAGTLVIGLGLGVIQSIASAFIGSSWQSIAGLVILVLVLVIRPQGLFGKRARLV